MWIQIFAASQGRPHFGNAPTSVAYGVQMVGSSFNDNISSAQIWRFALAICLVIAMRNHRVGVLAGEAGRTPERPDASSYCHKRVI